MSATITIYELTASMAGTDKTSGTVRHKLSDDQTVDANDPITIPSSATTTRSFHKGLRMYCSVAPDTNLSGYAAYSDGSNTFGTGITVNASNVGVTFSANATSALPNGTDLFAFTSGSPMALDVTDSTAQTATGFFGDIIKTQMNIASSASSGTLSAETLTFSYDEI